MFFFCVAPPVRELPAVSHVVLALEVVNRDAVELKRVVLAGFDHGLMRKNRGATKYRRRGRALDLAVSFPSGG